MNVTNDPLISATGLGALRGERVLFRNLSFEASAGECVMLRGRNGAGKSTLLRILAGLTKAEVGSARCSAFHWVSHREGLKPHETPREHLHAWARAWGGKAQEIPDILDRLGLARPADVPARLLSAGQRRRTALARLAIDPRPVWLLDEPFSALDQDGRGVVETLIADHLASRGAVAMAVHGEVGVPATFEVTL